MEAPLAHSKRTVTLIEGIYEGIWSGYEVTIHLLKGDQNFRTNIGTRGTTRIKVIVKNDRAYLYEL